MAGMEMEGMINKIICGDSWELARQLPDESLNCIITSPPYWNLRDYQIDSQFGLESTPEEYVSKLVALFRELKRALKKDGTVWLNLGDSYVGGGRGCNTEKQQSNKGTRNMPKSSIPLNLKPKDLCGIPWKVAFALQSDGWWLRQDIIWSKGNPMPESVTDRCTKSHEYIFLLSKNKDYYYDYESIKEEATGYDGRKDTFMKGSDKYKEHIMPNAKPQGIASRGHERWKYKNLQEDGQSPNTMHIKRLVGEEYLSPVRNKRSVWTVNTHSFSEAHFATFPQKLIEPMVMAGCPAGGLILDPFMGAGTTAFVAKKLNRNYIGFELNPEYIKIAERRLVQEVLPL